jgi:ATP-dependent Clp protease ATP-binding subunit ClpX
MNTQPMGFNSASTNVTANRENLLQYVTAQDLKAFGLIPELIGRLPVLTHLDPLHRSTLKRILTEPKNALVKQYAKLMAMEGVTLTFDEGALDFIVDKAVEYNLGARGLRSICEAIVTDAMYEIPSDQSIKALHIDEDYARSKFDTSKFKQLQVA